MKELKLPVMICWISIIRMMIWSRSVSTAAVGVETTNIMVWVARLLYPQVLLPGEGWRGVLTGGGQQRCFAAATWWRQEAPKARCW